MIDLFLGNGVVLFFIFVISIIFLFVGAFASFSKDEKVKNKIITIVLVVVGLIIGVVWVHGTMVYVVPANRVLLVIDRSTGKPSGELRQAGVTITQFPFTWDGYEFPAQSAYQYCQEFTPSASDGIGLKTNFCFVIDASKIDWSAEFLKRNGDEGKVSTAWFNELKSLVAVAVQGFKARELTTHRDQVSNAVKEQTAKWFSDNKIPLTLVTLSNWDFDDPAISKAFNEALLAQTQVQKAEADREAAKVERDTALFRADTQIQVAAKLATGQRDACLTAGMVTEGSCNQYLTLLWLIGLGNNQSANIIVSAGGNQPGVSVPLQPKPGTVTATPAPAK